MCPHPNSTEGSTPTNKPTTPTRGHAHVLAAQQENRASNGGRAPTHINSHHNNHTTHTKEEGAIMVGVADMAAEAAVDEDAEAAEEEAVATKAHMATS